ncbi:PEP-CTERM sorting domain-containing protein [Xylophilus sp. GOD-11R]|nr:PEP-CTERM sorting domain-containing protein [Xylophilus sp. GOD-11R]WPB57438.1 PEP-CTERM sorting domain-containing protein [Xylophilus sp. GOD-11R]
MRLRTLFLAKKMLCVAAVSMVATAASADPYFYNYTGDTTNGLVVDGFRAYLLNFQVGASGSYDFWSGATGFDIGMVLYSYPFDPTNVTANLISVADNNETLGHESFSEDLTAGVKYSLAISSGHRNGYGPFDMQISGPGAITPLATVPEPETFAMLLAGLGLTGGLARRRRANKNPSTC